MFKKEINCEICNIDKVSYKIELTLKHNFIDNFVNLPNELRKHKVNPLYVCGDCFFFIKKLEAKNPDKIKCKKLKLDKIPEKFIFSNFIYEIKFYGIRAMIKAWLERLSHKVSWIEANGLDEWLLSEIAKIDLNFKQLYKEYVVNEYLSIDDTELDRIKSELKNYLVDRYTNIEKLNFLWKQLKYIFSKYGDFYKYDIPISINGKEWNNLVENLKIFFNTVDKKDNPICVIQTKDILIKFYKNIFAFWW